MQTAQADKNAIAPNRSASSPDQEPSEITEARGNVHKLESRVWWAKTFVIIVLVLAGAIGVGIAVFTLRTDWITDDLRAAEKNLTTLEMGVVEAKAATEAKRIETEGKERLDKAKRESDEKIAGLTAEAERAKTERAEADRQIAIAKADAARAKEGIANAEAVSAKAGVEVARLQVVVANAEKSRLEAERALLELQERVKPRRLTAKESADFVRVLRTFPNETVDFGHTAGAADEGFTFARQLIPLFKEAGWTIRNEASIAYHLDISVIGVGILMRGPAGEPNKPPPPGEITLTPAVATLRVAFRAVGIDVQFINMGPGRDEKIVEVVVGSKPEP